MRVLFEIIVVALMVFALAGITYIAYRMVQSGHGADTYQTALSQFGLTRTYSSWIIDVSLAAIAIVIALLVLLWSRLRQRLEQRRGNR